MLRLAIFVACLVALPALAQEAEPPSTGGQFIGRIFNALKPRQAPERPTADFVRDSRPADLQYRPFDPTPEKKPDRRKTAEEMQRVTSQLEAAAAANRHKASRVGVPDGPTHPRAR